MICTRPLFSIILGIVLAGGTFCSLTSYGATSRSQQIAVKAGWNAIYVEVDPANPAPASVFDPALVDVVACYFTPLTTARFAENPDEQSFNAPGWSVYYGATRTEAFLTSLHAIQGGNAYLVHALADGTLTVTGDAKYVRKSWVVDSFNLTGFPVVEGASITFARFFAGAGGKLGTRVYRLVGGSWQKIADLSTTAIRSGEAYWVYCEGGTAYQGPLDVRFKGSELSFGSQGHQITLEYANRLDAPITVTAAIESNDGLPLYRSVPDPATVTSASSVLGGGTSLGSLAGADVGHLIYELRRERMTVAAGSAVLKLSTSDGVVLRIPTRASKP